MAVYEFVCLACEHRFEERRSVGASVDVALACPSCGADRVRRRFSVFSAGAAGAASSASIDPASGSGCCGGGGCACGH